MSNELRIIPAEPAHVPLVLQFIQELAEFEKLTDSVVATEELLHESLFGADPKVEAVLAYWADEPAGFALFFHNFSTCLGRPGLYLEDVFVRPAFRGKGIGQSIRSFRSIRPRVRRFRLKCIRSNIHRRDFSG